MQYSLKQTFFTIQQNTVVSVNQLIKINFVLRFPFLMLCIPMWSLTKNDLITEADCWHILQNKICHSVVTVSKK